MTARLLAGPDLAAGAEPLAAHVARLGQLPGRAMRADRAATAGRAARTSPTPGAEVIPLLESAGLLGRGGAGFPVARKWASVAERAGGHAVVLANGAEGEPLSSKDRVLMSTRPHLVLDGAELAAEAVGAERIVLYVGEEHVAARTALRRALDERLADASGVRTRVPTEILAAPRSYIAGEESAAVHFVNEGDARPTTTPPRPFERGVDDRSTLVQNVESFAHVALIARFGDGWYREAGRGQTRGTALVTVGGAPRPGVTEIEIGATLAEIAASAGAPVSGGPVLLGGYFGGWVSGAQAWHAPLDPPELRLSGAAFGCGVIWYLGPADCGVRATARILDYMAGQSAAQCGPCVFGLRAIADATARLAVGTAHGDDLRRVSGWSETLAGRGACRHPDGAIGLLRSALAVFEADFASHQRGRGCVAGEQAWRAAS